MKPKQQGRLEACGTTQPYRRHLGGYSRMAILKGIARGGVLAGLLGYGAVLVSREDKFECSTICGGCVKLKDGQCSLGLK